jgi:Tfp pilus assembly protein PilF/SAM-dependent methyltransferase
MNRQNEQTINLIRQGLDLMNDNRLQEAKRIFTQICETDPQETEAWYQLSTINGRLGEFSAADECCRRVLDIEPDHCEARVNLGNVLYSQGKFDDAIIQYQEALQLNPNYTVAHNKLGVALANIGKSDEALESFRDAIRLKPDYADAYRNMGYVYVAQGKQTEALSAFQEALRAEPNSADAHNDIGALLFEKGEIEQAVSCFQRALEINPQHIRALNNLGIACRSPEKFPLYFAFYRNTIDLLADPEQARIAFIENIRLMDLARYDPWLNGELIRCFSIPDANYTAITLIAARHLKYKYIVDPISTDDQKDLGYTVDQISSDDLFIIFLEKTINIDADLELFLAKVRRALLFKYCRDDSLGPQEIRVIVALAYQCFNNEYVFAVGAEEQLIISNLKSTIEQLAISSTSFTAKFEANLFIYSMYERLHSLSCRERLAGMPPATWSEKLGLLLEQMLIAPLEEEKIKSEIETIGDIEDQTSKLVRSQYEENPYPRWLPIRRLTTKSVKQVFKQFFPYFPAPTFLDGPINILVAGCGTGQHPIARASLYHNAEILGVDISKSSLAYAIKMARQLGVKNIRFMHGDILQLSKLDERFHIIECGGVLHHMEDPLQGWKVLCDLLVDNGLMFIGLYSEKARKPIAAARDVIQREKIIPDQNNIRAFRQRIMRHELGDILYRLCNSSDFYSMSRCRDLLFHFREHRYTLQQLERAIADLHLTFLGFEFDNMQIIDAYRKQHPQDKDMTNLTLWDQFETQHPNTFVKMYNFWCQKKG